jgi:hypothetical protein
VQLDNNDLQRLVEQVANHLAGQEVQIRWQEPSCEHALGQIYRTPEGKVIVDISDNLSLSAKFDVFLHELAHVRLGHAQIATPGNDYKQPSQRIKRSQNERYTWRTSKPEADADQLAHEWLTYAQAHTWKFERIGEPDIAAHLRALLKWHK